MINLVVAYVLFIFVYYSITLFPHSFIPGLKPSFSANLILPTVAFLFFFRTDYIDSPDCLLLLRAYPFFYFLVFFVFPFSVVVSVR